jgi:hypothetical protein
MKALLITLLAACNASPPGLEDNGVPDDLSSLPGDDLAAPMAVSGTVYDWLTVQPSSAAVEVSLFDGLRFFSNPQTPPITTTTALAGSYSFAALPFVSSRVLVVAFAGSGLARVAVARNVGTATSLVVDGWALPLSLLSSWSATVGTNLATHGALLDQFCSDAAPSIASCHGVAGLSVENAWFIGPARDQLSAGASATGALGLAIDFAGPRFNPDGGACASTPGLQSTVPGVIFWSQLGGC